MTRSGRYVLLGAVVLSATLSGCSRPDPAEVPDEVRTVNVGAPVADGTFTFTVLSTSTRRKVGDPPDLGKKAKGRFLIARVKIHNNGEKPRGLTDTAQQLYGPGPTPYSDDSEAAIYANPEAHILYDPIKPGRTRAGVILFDVPKSFQPERLVLHESLFSAGATVNLHGG